MLRRAFFRDEAVENESVYADNNELYGETFFCQELSEQTLERVEDFPGYASQKLGITPEQFGDVAFLQQNPQINAGVAKVLAALYDEVLAASLVGWSLPRAFNETERDGLTKPIKRELAQRIIGMSSFGADDSFFTQR